MAETENTGDLQPQLTRLRSDAEENLQQLRATRSDLWRLLARTYIWWREASQHPSFLEEEYQRAHIKFNKRNDVDVNFNPVIKLVWNIRHPSGADKRAISNWTQTLEIFHKRYSETPEAFQHEPVGKLMALIDEKGGVSGLIAADEKDGGSNYLGKGAPPADEVGSRHNQAKSMDSVLIDEPTEAALAQHTKSVFLRDEQGIGSVTATFPVVKDDDDFTVLLARVTADGRTIVMDSTNDQALVKAVLRKVGRMDATSVHPQILSLGDAIRVQMLPFVARPPREQRSTWFLKKFADKTDFYTTDLSSSRKEGKKRRLTSSRRVHVLNNGSRIVVSGGMLRASVVVIHDLKAPLFPIDRDIFLRTVDRPFLEELFDKKAAHAWGVEVLPRTDDDEQKAIITIAVSNKNGGRPKFLRFYSLDKANIAHQVPMPSPGTLKPIWRVTVGIEWLRNAKLGWARLWFAELGRRNNMFDVDNKRLKVTVRKDKMIIGYANDDFQLPFETDAEIAEKVPSVEFFSKDLAPILHNLLDVEPISSVELSGDMHCLTFKFETYSGQTQIVVPAINKNDETVRDPTHFYVDAL